MNLIAREAGYHGRLKHYLESAPALVAALAGLLAIQQFVSLGAGDLLGNALSNAAHVPLFAAIALLMCRLLRFPRAVTLWLVCLALAALSEGLQMFSDRHASFHDVVLDTLGMSPVIAGLYLRGRLHGSGGPRTGAAATWLTVAVLLALCTAAGPARVLLAYQDRDRAFPTLLDPARWQQAPLLVSSSAVTVRPAPAAWSAYADHRVLQVVWANQPYPNITLFEVVADWRGYTALAVDVFIAGDSPMTLTASVRYAGDPSRASWAWRNLEPGPRQVRYPLDELLDGHTGIASLVLHAQQSDAGRTAYIGRVSLLGDSAAAD